MQYMKLSEVQREELIAALAGMKKFLREAFGSLPPEETRTPGPRLLLASGTGLAFGRPGVRVRSSHPAAANRTNPHLLDFDGAKIARERNYRALSLAEGLRAFEAAREANLRTLETLSPEAWMRSGTQDGVGSVSLCDMPAFLHQHDQAHMAEIEEWKKFAARSGDA